MGTVTAPGPRGGSGAGSRTAALRRSPSKREHSVIFEPRQRTRPLLRITLGEVLRRIRLEQERTLADVASSARVSMPYLSEIERGRKEASSEVLAALCEALGIGLSDLLADVRHELAPERADEAVVIRLGSGGGGAGPVAPAPGPAHSGRAGGDVVCLLAA